jgi:hypothetical protein
MPAPHEFFDYTGNRTHIALVQGSFRSKCLSLGATCAPRKGNLAVWMPDVIPRGLKVDIICASDGTECRNGQEVLAEILDPTMALRRW